MIDYFLFLENLFVVFFLLEKRIKIYNVYCGVLLE